MRIALFSDTYLPQVNGVVSALELHVRELLALGHEVLLVVPKVATPVEHVAHKHLTMLHVTSVPALIYPHVRLGLPLSLYAYKKVYKFNADVIHYHTEFMMGMTAIMLAKAMGLPLVGSFHTYFMRPEFLEVYGVRKGKQLLFGLLKKEVVFFHHRADLLLVPSQVAKQDLIAWGYEGRIVVLPYPVEVEVTRTTAIQKKELRQRLGITATRVLLYVGRLSKEKSLGVLLEAFNKVRMRDDDCQLVIIGDGPARLELEALIKELNLENLVRMTGMLEHATLLRDGYHTVADCFVTPSGSETLGVSVLEAMAYGLPVVAVAMGGVQELVDGNGFLATFDDVDDLAMCLEKMLRSSESEIKTMSLRSLALVKDYSPRIVAGSLVELYASVLPLTRSRSWLPSLL